MSVVPYVSEPPAYTAEWLLDPAEIAQRIGGTDFVPRALRDNPAAITAALLYGAEVGLGRMASLATIAVIDGRPALSAEAQRALILAAGHEVWFEEATAARCIACGRRKGSATVQRFTWTIDDAKRAGLAGRNNWRTYPRAMLMARASAELARAAFPDVIHGLFAAEELDGDVAAESKATPPPEDKPKTRTRKRKPPEDPPPDETPPNEPPSNPEPDPGGGPRPSASGPVADPGEEQAEVEEVAGEVEAIVHEFARPDPEAKAAERWEAPAPAEARSEYSEQSEQGPLPASDAQLRGIFALMHDVGIGDPELRAERLAYTSKVVQREIGTSSDLTQDEAHAVIEDLQRVAGLPEDSMQRSARLFGTV